MRFDIQYEARLAGCTEVEAENEAEAIVLARDELRESGDEVIGFHVQHIEVQECDGD